jgi:hypothetical protein
MARRIATAVAVGAVLVTVGTAAAVYAATDTDPEPDLPEPDMQTAMHLETDALQGTGLEIPKDWAIVDVRTEHHDERAVTVIRHQPDEMRLGGPHATVVLDAEGTILGYTRLTEEDAGAALLDEAEAERHARNFLRELDPGYLEGLSVNFVQRHDEAITAADGTELTVSGMKVKFHHDGGLYAWVIIGPDGRVLTFERDIAWDSGQGRRGTQMWLHDSWIAAYEGTGPQPDAPYAVAKP